LYCLLPDITATIRAAGFIDLERLLHERASACSEDEENGI
jgi:hypothetical protein